MIFHSSLRPLREMLLRVQEFFHSFEAFPQT